MASPWSATYALPVLPAGSGASAPRTSTGDARRSSVAPVVPDILERPRDKTRATEVSISALQYLFAEMVAYAQSRVSGITEFERLLSSMGRQVGVRALVLLAHRTQTATNPKRPRRETRLLPTLLWVHGAFWKAVFGAQADSLERSTESERSDECACVRGSQLTNRHDLHQRAALLAWHLSTQGNDTTECRGVCRRDCGRSA